MAFYLINATASIVSLLQVRAHNGMNNTVSARRYFKVNVTKQGSNFSY